MNRISFAGELREWPNNGVGREQWRQQKHAEGAAAQWERLKTRNGVVLIFSAKERHKNRLGASVSRNFSAAAFVVERFSGFKAASPIYIYINTYGRRFNWIDGRFQVPSNGLYIWVSPRFAESFALPPLYLLSGKPNNSRNPSCLFRWSFETRCNLHTAWSFLSLLSTANKNVCKQKNILVTLN